MEIGGEGNIRFLILEFPRVSVTMANMNPNDQAARGADLIVELGSAGRKVFGVEF